ncbi:hypothetical protein [Okeania sp. SIO2B9]|uniref:hypothetical protein n=1 Tax=Okeania sp. SIO2B9 TaxID=2607782 RepID=UPI00257DE855|nr:hypothetical protein [Okeania sp. SIO2B9]
MIKESSSARKQEREKLMGIRQLYRIRVISYRIALGVRSQSSGVRRKKRLK